MHMLLCLEQSAFEVLIKASLLDWLAGLAAKGMDSTACQLLVRLKHGLFFFVFFPCLTSSLSTHVILSYVPNAAFLTSPLVSGFGAETLKTVKCGTGDEKTLVSTWEKTSVVL